MPSSRSGWWLMPARKQAGSKWEILNYFFRIFPCVPKPARWSRPSIQFSSRQAPDGQNRIYGPPGASPSWISAYPGFSTKMLQVDIRQPVPSAIARHCLTRRDVRWSAWQCHQACLHSRHSVDRLHKKNHLRKQIRGALRADRPHSALLIILTSASSAFSNSASFLACF